MSGDTVGALVLEVCLSSVTGGIDATTGLLVSWTTVGYFWVAGVVADFCGTSKVVVAELEFLRIGSIGLFNVVEAVDDVLILNVFIGLVKAVSFNSVITGFSLWEKVKGDIVECDAMEVVIGFRVVSIIGGLSIWGITGGFFGMYTAVGGCKINGVGSVGIGIRLFNSVVELRWYFNPSCVQGGKTGLCTSVLSSGLGRSEDISKIREFCVLEGSAGNPADGYGGSGGNGGGVWYGRFTIADLVAAHGTDTETKEIHILLTPVHVKWAKYLLPTAEGMHI